MKSIAKMHKKIIFKLIVLSIISCMTCQPIDETDCGYAYTFKDMKIMVRNSKYKMYFEDDLAQFRPIRNISSRFGRVGMQFYMCHSDF